jgi:hypothetical protein
VFVPTEPVRPFDRDRYLASAAALKDEMAQKGIDPEDLIQEFDELRRRDHPNAAMNS